MNGLTFFLFIRCPVHSRKAGYPGELDTLHQLYGDLKGLSGRCGFACLPLFQGVHLRKAAVVFRASNSRDLCLGGLSVRPFQVFTFE